jgi:hypothetical protein
MQVMSPELLGDYHLLLAHDVLDHPVDYRCLFGERTKQMFVLLDNSLIELGYPMELDDLLEAAAIVRASVIALPDHLGDMHKTCVDSQDFYQRLLRKYGGSMANCPDVTGVVQGQTIQECMYCADVLVRQCNSSRLLCVPRVLVKTLGTRMGVCCALGVKYPGVPIHLMGFSDNILDDVSCARLPNVVGIDSAVPIRAALRGMKMTLNTGWFDPGPRGDYWATPQTVAEACMADIEVQMTDYRRWISVPYRHKQPDEG